MTKRKEPAANCSGADPHPATAVLQHFVANLYLSAPGLGAEDYRDWALAEARQMVRCDAALWGTGSALTGNFHSLTLQGLPATFSADLVRTRDDNPLFEALQDEPGTSITMLDVVTESAFRRSKVYKKCFRKHGIEHILATRNVDTRTGLSSLITLYRSDPDQPFSDQEKQLQQVIAYHLGKAATHAFFLHLTRPDPRTANNTGAAVIDRHGIFHEAEAGFMDMLDKHFPEREPGVLPFQLTAEECNMELNGLYIQASRLSDLILLRIRESGPLDQLTRRERQVVEGVCQGLSHKEIGRELGLAPTTVSSHLYRAYEKLGVASKTALSRLIRGTSRLHSRATE